MNNLNKYSKAELINKVKKLDNKNSNQNNRSLLQLILDNIFYFKGLIIKITLITFIMKWFRKYSIIQKLWHIFSLIGNTILGYSLFDIYSLDIISWIKDSQIYNWYLGLFNTHKIEKVEDAIPSFMRSTIENENGDSESSQRSSKNFGWINQTKIEDETQPFYYNKYFLIGALSLTTLISWYYFEEIKTGYVSIMDWINSFRPTPPDSSTGSNTNSSTGNNTNSSTTSNRLDIQQRLGIYFKEPAADITKDIELVDSTQPVAADSIIDKGKGVLTSPSLESLNNNATNSWAEGSSSPKSDSSSSTITPSNLAESSKLSESVLAIPYITNNWKELLPKDFIKRIKIIDDIWSSEKDITLEESDVIITALAQLQVDYNFFVEIFNSNLPSLETGNINSTKQIFYHLRVYLHKYNNNFLPLKPKNIIIGNLDDDLIPIKY